MDNDCSVLMALSGCKELATKPSTFWRNHSLILTPDTKPMARDLNLGLDSRIYHISATHLFEIFKYNSHDSEVAQQEIGRLDATGPKLVKPVYIWDRRTNLSRVHLNIVYLNRPPFVFVEEGSIKVGGFLGDVFHYLQNNLGFRYSLHHQEDDKWGSLGENGTYDGLLGKLQSGNMSWSLADTTQSLERSGDFDFSMPVVHAPKRLVTRRPAEDFGMKGYFVVFSLQFWIVLLISASVQIVFLYWILRLDSVDDKYQSNRMAAAFTFTMLCLCSRGGHGLDANWSGKILSMVILFWGFLISVSYNAILTSVLASSPPIGSLEQLLDSSDYTLVFKTNGSITNFFKRSNNSIGNYSKSEAKIAIYAKVSSITTTACLIGKFLNIDC